jgi:hypothetical protein
MAAFSRQLVSYHVGGQWAPEESQHALSPKINKNFLTLLERLLKSSSIEAMKEERFHYRVPPDELPKVCSQSTHETFHEIYYDTTSFDFMSAGIWILSRTYVVAPPRPKIWILKVPEKFDEQSGSLFFQKYYNIPDIEIQTFKEHCHVDGIDIEPFCSFKVQRRFIDHHSWIDICLWTWQEYKGSRRLYVVGTSSNEELAKEGIIASKILAYIGDQKPRLLYNVAPAEQDIAKRATFYPLLPGIPKKKYAHEYDTVSEQFEEESIFVA